MTTATLDKELAKSLLKFGYSWSDFMRMTGLPLKQVRAMIKGMELKRTGEIEAVQTFKEILELRQQGQSFADIAGKYGINPKIVERFFNRMKKEVGNEYKPVKLKGLPTLKKAYKVVSRMLGVYDSEPWGEEFLRPKKDYGDDCTLPRELHPWIFAPRNSPCLAVAVIEEGKQDNLDNYFLMPVLTLIRIGYKVGEGGEIIVPASDSDKIDTREGETGWDENNLVMGLDYAFPGVYCCE